MIEAGARLISDRFELPFDWWTSHIAREIFEAMIAVSNDVR